VPRLDTWGRVLSDPLMGQQSFVIGGHTDDVGTEDYNQELSVRRARAVKDFLVSKYGIAPSRLDVSGYGKARPLVQGTSDAERSANRRVDFERLTRPGQARP
jgi:outer membrane protein OmpA-like peptidoglycan-associated protein